MYLTSLSGALTELDLDDTTDLRQGTTIALEAATQQLASDLRNGSFDRVTVTDYFCLDVRYIIRPSLRGELKLARGWVDSGQPITITAGSRWTDLSGVAPIEPFTESIYTLNSPIDISDYVVWDYEKGHVKIVGATLKMYPWIKVTYTAGFLPNGSDANQYDNVPEWLQNLCMMNARNLLADVVPSKESGDRATPTLLLRAYNLAVMSWCRYFPGARLPESSDLTASDT